MYGTICTVDIPIPSGEINTRKDPLYNLNAVIQTNYGYVRNHSGNGTNDDRQVNVTFSGITANQLRLLITGSEVLVRGGIVSNFTSRIGFSCKAIKAITPPLEEGVNAISAEDLLPHIVQHVCDSLTSKAIDHDPEEIFKALKIVVPAVRTRIAVVIPSGCWTIKATPTQVESAQFIEIPLETERV